MSICIIYKLESPKNFNRLIKKVYFRTGSNNMLPFAIATLNGHSNWFKALGLAVPSIAGRREYFESRDEKNRTFTHLAAISGYKNKSIILLLNGFIF